MKVPFVDLKTQYNSIKNEIDQAIQNVLDKTSFPICEVKEKEIGFARKRIWYIHRLKNGWEIIQIHPKYIHQVYSTTNE